MVRNHEIKSLRLFRGVEGLASRVKVSLNEGVKTSDVAIRQKFYGFNRYSEKPSRGFWMFVWDALQDLTLTIYMVCAVVSVVLGLATKGWPKGMYDGLGIVLSIFLVILVTAVSDYKQSLQFQKRIFIKVTRDKLTEKASIYDLVVGDVVHLSTGDQVPADGILISGLNLLVDESSLSGKSVPINKHKTNPFLLAGTKVQDGSGKMLVTTVGVRTEWGKLMVTLSEGGEDDTLLQGKLNGIATNIGKLGLVFAVLTFTVLTVRFLVEKALHKKFRDWSSRDALTILNYFTGTVAPEGLPLAVTLTIAFAMKKLMNEKAINRLLCASETMGSECSKPEVCSKTPEYLKEMVPTMYEEIPAMAWSSPMDQHTLVTHSRNTFQEVDGVTSDGTNDAPAVHEADIGLARDIGGTEDAKENADVVDANSTTRVEVGKWGPAVYANIQKFVQFQLTVNVVALMINFLSACISGGLVELAFSFLQYLPPNIIIIIFFFVIFRIWTPYSCAAAMGQSDHGYTRCIGTGYPTTE
ncbi:unnamed protein product [Ilex paraguariensis]|uniref:Cation-transporting P-type ATPase N-terminal domain-containing protein n=1 Tax=Ilex paraguariensis TaxID=185542 RepID=A0ABC8TGY1_9AQUA